MLKGSHMSSESGLFAPIIGHVGDGNFHSTIFIDPDDDAMLQRALELDRRMVERAQAMGGTCTGEHGIGIGKRKFMQLEHGESYQLMRSIKEIIDPKGLMNPGKIFL